MTTATATEGYTSVTVIELDPAAVAVDPKNARRKLTGIKELAESIRKVGQLVPVLVMEKGDGTYQLIAGARRRAATEEAGVALRAIVHDGSEQVNALVALIENDARQDLTVTERAAAVQRVLDLGTPAEDVVAATGASPADIAAAQALVKSKKARAAAEKHPEMTMEHAAALAEFDGDPKTQERLLDVITRNPGYFDHAVAEYRRDRDELAAAEEKLAVFREAGVKILDKAGQDKATDIGRLTDAKGKKLTARGHKSCPGNAAGLYISPRWGEGPSVRIYCTDPKANGHKEARLARTTRPTGPEPTEAERQKAAEERRTTIANNRALATANGVRLEYVAALVQGRKAIAGLPAFLAEQFIAGHVSGQAHNVKGEVWEQISGKKASTGWRMTPAKPILSACKNDRDYLVALFGYVAAYHESLIDKTAWRQSYGGRAAYIKFLEGTGYTLTDQERMIVTQGAKDR